MTKNPSNPVTAAVRELRLALGDTQQSFAQRLGLAISTVVRYELTRPPKGNALRMLARVAEENKLEPLASCFRQALAEELGSWDPGDLKLKLEPQTNTERLWVSAILAVLRNPHYASLVPKLVRLLREPAENSIKVLEWHKSMSQLRKQALSMLEQGIAQEQIAKVLNLPINDIRKLAAWREFAAALEDVKELEEDQK